MSLSLACVLTGILAIVSLTAIGCSMSIVNGVKYLKLKKCYVGSSKEKEWHKVRQVWREAYKLLFVSKQDLYIEGNKLYPEYNELDSAAKVTIAGLFHLYNKNLLIMQLICMCFIILIPPMMSLLHSCCRAAGNDVFFIPYAIFFLAITLIVGIVRKRVAIVLSLMQTNASMRGMNKETYDQ